MQYRQLIILILAIWAGQIAVPYAFENIIPKKIDYRTYYLRADEDGLFKGKELEEAVGEKGWVLTNVVPDPSDSNQMICFFKRQTIVKWGR